MSEQRPPFYLVTGLLFGLGLGYLISVVLFPASAAEGAPWQLSQADKAAYRSLAAQAYAVSNNLERAAARMALLKDADAVNQLAADAQRMLAEGKPLADAEVLARLASALGSRDQQAPAEAGETPAGSGVPVFTPDPAGDLVPSPTAAPQATGTPAPTPSPAPTLGAPFQLAEQLIICQAEAGPGLIQVQVEDQAGRPIPGMKVDITWQDGQEFFFTGLVPSVNPGYADFRMAEGKEYSLQVGGSGEQVRGIAIPECSAEDGEKYPGSVYLRFTQP